MSGRFNRVMSDRLRGLFCGLGVSRVQIAFVTARYGSAAAVALETLFFARVLGPAAFGTYSLLPQIVVLITIGALGHPAGYVYAYFRNPAPDLDDLYVAGASTQYILSGLIAALVVSASPLYLVAVTLYFIQIPYLLTEPMLRVREHFAFTAFGRGITSLLTMTMAAGWILLRGHMDDPLDQLIDMREAVILLLTGHVCGYGVYYYLLRRFGFLSFRRTMVLRALLDPGSWGRYGQSILRPGIPLNASSAILSVFNNIPRLIIERYYSSSALSVYSLAWQVSQGSMVMLSSMNLISAIRVGDSMARAPANIAAVLKRQLRTVALAGVLAFAILLLVTVILSRVVYSDYEDLILMAVCVSFGYLVMNIVGAVIGVLFYERRSTALNVGYVAATAATLAAGLVCASLGYWYGWIAIIASFFLTALNAWFLMLVFRNVKQIEEASGLPKADSANHPTYYAH